MAKKRWPTNFRRAAWFELLSEVGFLSLRSDGLHKVPSIGCYLDAGLRADMPAQRGAALLHLSFARLALGLERTLLVFPSVLVRGVIDFGRTVRFNDLMLNTLPIRDLSSAFCVPVGTKILGAAQRRCFLFCFATHDALLYRTTVLPRALYTDTLLFLDTGWEAKVFVYLPSASTVFGVGPRVLI